MAALDPPSMIKKAAVTNLVGTTERRRLYDLCLLRRLCRLLLHVRVPQAIYRGPIFRTRILRHGLQDDHHHRPSGRLHDLQGHRHQDRRRADQGPAASSPDPFYGHRRSGVWSCSPWSLRPANIVFLFLNGLPLGMIWGIVFSYIEGRKRTDFIALVLCSSFVLASGFVKSVGKAVLNWGVPEFSMPFVTGAIFFAPLLASLWMLESLPPPTEEDRVPSHRTDSDARPGAPEILPGFRSGLGAHAGGVYPLDGLPRLSRQLYGRYLADARAGAVVGHFHLDRSAHRHRRPRRPGPPSPGEGQFPGSRHQSSGRDLRLRDRRRGDVSVRESISSRPLPG